jgi:hypothetical protein
MLPRLLGPARALDLLLSGRVLLAEEALQLGFVNRVVPGDALIDQTTAYARDLAANCSPGSMAVIKAQVYRDLDSPLAPALERSLREMELSLATEDFKEGVASYVEQRAPKFPPLGEKRGRPRNPAVRGRVSHPEMRVTTRLLLAAMRMAQAIGPSRYRLSCRKAALRLESRLAF